MSTHTAFDIVAWLSALLTTWLMYRWRFQARIHELSDRLGAGYYASITLGGLAGAYGFGTLNAYLSGQPAIARSILGGLVGAITLVQLYKLKKGIRGPTGAVLAVPFCVAIAIGRLGCFYAGLADLTHGTETALPWGVDFGDGVLRHPVQIYESLTMLAAGLALVVGLWMRSSLVQQHAFHLAVGAYGAQRFIWEFFKPYKTVAGPLNVFHILSLALCVYAVWMIYGTKNETA
jgi:phosphatidylglycerol:prolipoprotein diacylglycerol transferase